MSDDNRNGLPLLDEYGNVIEKEHHAEEEEGEDEDQE